MSMACALGLCVCVLLKEGVDEEGTADVPRVVGCSALAGGGRAAGHSRTLTCRCPSPATACLGSRALLWPA